MKKKSFNHGLFLTGSIIKRTILVAMVTMIVLLGVCYYLNQEIIKKVNLNVQNLITNKNDYSANILTSSELPSNITENTYLTKGTYTVSNDLMISYGVTLEVEAGTIIQFSNYKKMT